MAGYRFRIVTLRSGVEVNRVVSQTRLEADQAFNAAVEKAQQTAQRQRTPRRVELRDGLTVVVAMDVRTSR